MLGDLASEAHRLRGVCQMEAALAFGRDIACEATQYQTATILGVPKFWEPTHVLTLNPKWPFILANIKDLRAVRYAAHGVEPLPRVPTVQRSHA